MFVHRELEQRDKLIGREKEERWIFEELEIGTETETMSETNQSREKFKVGEKLGTVVLLGGFSAEGNTEDILALLEQRVQIGKTLGCTRFRALGLDRYVLPPDSIIYEPYCELTS